MMKELAERIKVSCLVSSDLPEIIGISDRVVVLIEAISGKIDRQVLSEEKISIHQAGGYKWSKELTLKRKRKNGVK
ncbi:MAG: hypothetical protein U5K84_03530 [Alkalibacterium sp.]|nr:hypothetical protein [Alkalibacterium sp.]